MKKLFLGLALCLALVTVAPAAVISVVDNFSVAQNSPGPGLTAFLGTTPVSSSQAGVWGNSTQRTLTSIYSLGDSSVASQVNFAGQYYSFSQDTATNGAGEVKYSLGGVDLTNVLSYAFSLDFVSADNPGGTLEFFIEQGVTRNSIFLALGAPGGTLGGSVSTAGMTAATALGFKIVGASEVDYRFDNFSASVPEPGTYALMGAGLAALAFLRRRK